MMQVEGSLGFRSVSHVSDSEECRRNVIPLHKFHLGPDVPDVYS